MGPRLKAEDDGARGRLCVKSEVMASVMLTNIMARSALGRSRDLVRHVTVGRRAVPTWPTSPLDSNLAAWIYGSHKRPARG